ncbi:hypothetical protein ACO2Q8_01620 [Larkinella sp. VNQ87]|uniref:hypothetical protein n=1 Tax=Larkinella sp. VNQ87 TaxID=3400921 RepID=UPI003BFB508C
MTFPPAMKPFVISSLLTANHLNLTFQRHFPFLKLQLYSPYGRPLEGAEKELMMNTLGRPLGELRWLAIDPDMSVSSFETTFHYLFGLRVEVLRKTGYTWDDLEHTKHWSLRQQNRKGEQIAMMHTNDSGNNLIN